MRPPRSVTADIRRPIARALDVALEATIVGSFSRVGYLLRRATQEWGDPPSARGRTFLVTGASSGVGRAVADGLARLGADLVLGGRDLDRLEAVAGSVREKGVRARTWRVDLGRGADVDAAALDLADELERLDGIVHSAGALLPHFTTDANGVEMTVATHLLAPFRVTWHLADRLAESDRPTIVTVSSGGMYTQALRLASLEMAPGQYRGATAYARAKRAQVVLAHEWSRRWSASGLRSYAMHPGWTDTPGLAESLPRFSRLGPLLRRPDEGADTAVWLAAGGAGTEGTRSGIWLDRRRRSEYYLPGTRPADASLGDELWRWCEQRTGLSAASD